jgi:hypothetical protein
VHGPNDEGPVLKDAPTNYVKEGVCGLVCQMLVAALSTNNIKVLLDLMGQITMGFVL